MQKDDYTRRILRANGKAEELEKILQDECRRRASKKLAATLSSCASFRFPTALSAEQCTSDALAEFHATLIAEGSRVGDLTCGLGIDAFHFAHKASSVTALDVDATVAAAVMPNASALGLTNVKAHCIDCQTWLEECSERFDVLFIDPARRSDDGSRLYSLQQCQPNVVELQDAAFKVSPKLIIKVSPMLDVTRVAAELQGVMSIHAVGTKAECKELLIETQRGYEGPITVWADTIGERSISFRLGQRFSAHYAESLSVGDTLGEPWPAVMKIASSGVLGDGQLAPSTMLWRNPDTASFPGNVYMVERIESFTSSTLKRLAKERPAASVATRNFPLTASQLRERIKARENSGMRLMATTLHSSAQILAFLSPIVKKNA